MLSIIEIVLIIISLCTLSKLNNFVYFRNFREFDRRFNFMYIITKTILFSIMSVLSMGLVGKFTNLESSTLTMMKFIAGYVTFIKSAFYYSTDLERIRKQTMKVFLDIDGVLNNTKMFSDFASAEELGRAKEEWKKKYDTYILNSHLIDDFNWAVSLKPFRCKYKYLDVVLSSTWRIAGFNIVNRLNNILRDHRFFDNNTIVDITEPYTGKKTRGEEINNYMLKYQGVDYIIIDDDDDFTDEQKKHHLIKVDGNVGFKNDDLINFMRHTDRWNKEMR